MNIGNEANAAAVPLGCKDCQAVGMWHCSDPIHCAGMKYGTQAEKDAHDRIALLEGLLRDVYTEYTENAHLFTTIKRIRAALEKP